MQLVPNTNDQRSVGDSSPRSGPASATRTALVGVLLSKQAQLPKDLDKANWISVMESVIGTDHPPAIMREVATAGGCDFEFLPSAKNLVDVILGAYERLGLPLSASAKEHADRRQATLDEKLKAEGKSKRLSRAELCVYMGLPADVRASEIFGSTRYTPHQLENI